MAAYYSPDSKEPVNEEPSYELDERANMQNTNGRVVAQKWRGTKVDKKDMRILGRVQELRRNFQFLSTTGLNCTLVSTWDIVLTTLTVPLINGGTGGFLWGYIIIFLGVLPVYLSMAEMASIAPTSGGQYHWVSEFAPKRIQKFLSYMVGWLSFTSWQAGVAGYSFFPGTIIQGLIQLNDESYVYHRWHGTCLMIAMVAIAILFNTFLAKKLPLLESLLLILYVFGMVAIIVTLWVLAPIGNSKDLWFTFSNGGMWNSDGTATMVGLVAALSTMIGFDCSVHMAEEVRNASTVVPRSMLSSVLFNGLLGLIMAITLAYTLGDVETVLNSPTGYPFIQILFDATKSYAATTILTVVVILVQLSGIVAELATSSRQMWSFARDRGMPFHRWVAHIKPGWDIPLNALVISFVITVLLSLINIGSNTALNALLSLGGVSFLTSYMISIGCILTKRIREPLPPSPFSLGRWGIFVNVLALCFLAPLYVFAFFPPATPAVAESMNWAVAIYGFVIIFAIFWYIVRGRKDYTPPVLLVKRNMDE